MIRKLAAAAARWPPTRDEFAVLGSMIEDPLSWARRFLDGWSPEDAEKTQGEESPARASGESGSGAEPTDANPGSGRGGERPAVESGNPRR